uniref:Uncharacterized protein n=1 Tax=Knipowitschia caucasica TaxID=637954 RepID=A0AAV2LCF5_KNICA
MLHTAGSASQVEQPAEKDNEVRDVFQTDSSHRGRRPEDMQMPRCSSRLSDSTAHALVAGDSGDTVSLLLAQRQRGLEGPEGEEEEEEDEEGKPRRAKGKTPKVHIIKVLEV